MARELELHLEGLNDDQLQQVERSIAHFNSAQEIFQLIKRGTCRVPLLGDAVHVPRFFSETASAPGMVVTGRRLSDNWLRMPRTDVLLSR